MVYRLKVIIKNMNNINSIISISFCNFVHSMIDPIN